MTNREKFIALVDNDRISRADVIVLLEGDGFNRYKHATSLYKRGFAAKIVFSGGITNYEYGSFPFSDIYPRLLEEGVPHEDIIHENKSLNTREQAIEVIKLAITHSWKRLILVATQEHQYRAYLTFLREILDVKRDLIVYNSPVRGLDWFSETGWGTRFSRMEEEFNRIEKYAAHGHLADFTDVIDYQKWKEAHS